jgi:hypothetical protein
LKPFTLHNYYFFVIKAMKNVQRMVIAIPVTGLDRPWGFQKVEASIFQDNRHIKVVRLSALRTGRPYPPGNIPGTYFC